MKYVTIILLVIIVAAAAYLGITQEKGPSKSKQAAENETKKEQTTSFGKKVEWNITGIEPGAGVMSSTEDAIEAYELSSWNLQQSSAASMLSALQEAVSNEKPIIVTAWQPHSAFAITNLRKLEDPQGIYNDPEATKQFLEENAPEYTDAEVSSDVLASVVYNGFAEDAPAANKFLSNFQIPAETQSNWIYEFNVNEKEASTVAANYIKNNRETVDSWKPAEDAELGKEKLTIGIPPWPGATVKSRVARDVLEEIGYEVTIREMDAGVVYTALADKQLDMTVAGWLPVTHEDYWNEKGDSLEIAGINVTQTWLGLAVPDYVDEDIQSIADLKKETE